MRRVEQTMLGLPKSNCLDLNHGSKLDLLEAGTEAVHSNLNTRR
jgi:hypothetical protein